MDDKQIKNLLQKNSRESVAPVGEWNILKQKIDAESNGKRIGSLFFKATALVSMALIFVLAKNQLFSPSLNTFDKVSVVAYIMDDGYWYDSDDFYAWVDIED